MRLFGGAFRLLAVIISSRVSTGRSCFQSRGLVTGLFKSYSARVPMQRKTSLDSSKIP